MSDLLTMINETLEVIKQKTKDEYETGIILGTGLGALVNEIQLNMKLIMPIYRISLCQQLNHTKGN